MTFKRRYRKKTKIVATLGPASSSPDILYDLYKNGADVFRVNFSHGTHEGHQKVIETIRALEKKVERPIAILADLQGPKLRVGQFNNGVAAIEIGQSFQFDSSQDKGDSNRVYLPHPDVIKSIQVGEMILLDDGKVRMVVTEKQNGAFVCEVLAGKELKDNKGFNLPNTRLDIEALTEKDRKDLAFALDQGVDWVALSFVQSPDDILLAKSLVEGRAGLIAKIEKPSAIRRIDEIIDVTDGVMIARGDLGVEMPPEQVPGLQKKIIRKCRKVGKPVIVATQMLESMIEAASPTRAEASDVATAVYEGSDAVMLSAETAAGNYPIESVKMMAKIAATVETDSIYQSLRMNEEIQYRNVTSDAITAAAKTVADTITAALIVTYTTSGSTTLRTARTRPSVPILALTSSQEVARRLTLSYGVRAVQMKNATDFEHIVEKASDIALREGMAEHSQRIVITAGVPFGIPGSTNALRVADVGSKDKGE